MYVSYEASYQMNPFYQMSPLQTLVFLAIDIIVLIATWKVFAKAGRPGWAAIIPFYNSYVLFDIVYGQGWKFLLMLIPFYNIYLLFKTYICLAHKFGKSTGFGVGLVFLSFIFMPMLGFGDARYQSY